MDITKFLIYGLSDPVTNEIRYIGKSCSGLKRANQHFIPSQLRADTYKTRWIISVIKSGLKPNVVILEEFKNSDKLNEREIFWIKYYKNNGARLTNTTEGGDGGNTKKSYLKYKPVICINTETGTKKRYDYIWQTELDGFSPTKVVATCKGKRYSHRGHYFHYENEILVNKIKKTKRAVIVQMNDKFLEFDSIVKAAKYLNVTVDRINYLLRFKSKIDQKIKREYTVKYK